MSASVNGDSQEYYRSYRPALSSIHLSRDKIALTNKDFSSDPVSWQAVALII